MGKAIIRFKEWIMITLGVLQLVCMAGWVFTTYGKMTATMQTMEENIGIVRVDIKDECKQRIDADNQIRNQLVASAKNMVSK